METVAKLYLNGKPAGVIYRSGRSTCWSYGLFDPEEGFAEFAPLFTCWASLMHVNQQGDELDEQTLAELRVAECAIDALDAKLFWPESNSWTVASQLNIDGRLVEWKEAGDIGEC